jgi:glyoxylase-like metal-dependent hydrolase (beta-lactamase superfamily II)
MNPVVKGFFDPDTWTVTYVVYQKVGSKCIIIDSVLSYDPKSGRTHTKMADQVVEFVKQNDLKTEWILETHAHADHVTAAPYLKTNLGGKVAIGDHISLVQGVFKSIFNLWHIKSAMQFLWVTQCLCRTSEQPVVISPAVMPMSSTNR